MTRPDDLDPELLAQLEGALRPEDPEAPAGRIGEFLAAEREAYEPAAAAVEAEAVRMAAWIRDTVRRDEAAALRRERTAAGGRRGLGWARILAFSVGAHVVLLGVLAVALVTEDRGPVAEHVAGLRFEGAPEDDRPFEEVQSERIAELRYRDLVNRDAGRIPDEIALTEQEHVAETVERLALDQPVGWDALPHPLGVAVPMLRRTNDGLKRRRLDLLGFNAQGTLRAVERGLRSLALRQDAESGWFRGDAGAPSLRASSIATLAFLGEGYTSQGDRAHDAVVARSVHAMRDVAGHPKRVEALDAGTVGPLTVALAEDYMLGYGKLTLGAERRRRYELERMGEVARRTLAQPDLPAETRTWLVWGLDAVRRAGISADPEGDRARLAAWTAATADTPLSRGATAQQALASATALLYAERGPQKPRFERWSRVNAEALLGRLKPTGGVREGDPVEDTALVLLALQAAYRTY